jgi:hypothetical protein
VIRKERLLRRLRRILLHPPSFTSNFSFVHPQSTVVSFPIHPFEFMNPPTFPIISSLWHGHLQDNTKAMIIILQRGRIREGEWGSILDEVTFERYIEGTNADQL